MNRKVTAQRRRASANGKGDGLFKAYDEVYTWYIETAGLKWPQMRSALMHPPYCNVCGKFGHRASGCNGKGKHSKRMQVKGGQGTVANELRRAQGLQENTQSGDTGVACGSHRQVLSNNVGRACCDRKDTGRTVTVGILM